MFAFAGERADETPNRTFGIDLCRPRFYLAAAEPVPRRGLDLFLEVVLC
jgi:hypothetical protein